MMAEFENENVSLLLSSKLITLPRQRILQRGKHELCELFRIAGGARGETE